MIDFPPGLRYYDIWKNREKSYVCEYEEGTPKHGQRKTETEKEKEIVNSDLRGRAGVDLLCDRGKADQFRRRDRLRGAVAGGLFRAQADFPRQDGRSGEAAGAEACRNAARAEAAAGAAEDGAAGGGVHRKSGAGCSAPAGTGLGAPDSGAERRNPGFQALGAAEAAGNSDAENFRLCQAAIRRMSGRSGSF